MKLTIKAITETNSVAKKVDVRKTEEVEDDFFEKLDRKRPNLPQLQVMIEPSKEIVERYAPLYELKFQSKIEGIEQGLDQVASMQKRDYLAE